MDREDFDASMSYWQTLRIVARGLIQAPVRPGEWGEFKEATATALYYASAPFIRLLAMILLPIAAPLFAWCVQVERRKTAAAVEAARKEADARRDRLVQRSAAAPPEGKEPTGSTINVKETP